MPLKNYGVLKGRPISSRLGAGSSPHYQIHIVDNTTDYRIAINVKSKLAPSELLYLVVDDFRHPMLDGLTALAAGFTRLTSAPAGSALDYIRGNLFVQSDLRPLAYAIPGPDNDLNEKIDAYVSRAIADENAEVYAFGERWGPESNRKDKYFGFLPGNGIHDIHMNQGNSGRFAGDNGVWQDGGLIFHYPAILDETGTERWPEQWVALFLAFQSQSWHTDDTTGYAMPLPGPEPDVSPTPQPGDRDGHVRIAAALVNPAGDDPGHETVTLINATPVPLDLTGWELADRNKKRSPVPPGTLAAGEVMRVSLDGSGAQLSNKGGIITLLDDQGLKIDGVSYTREEVRRQGWSLVF
ncbi:MAG TPA: DUF2278 family protein [Gammaproteobacteria bacterium]|nr:DUF2278 family protein [Gammaproteobacteria bacterium]